MNKVTLFSLLLFFLSFPASDLHSQCCSPGNPVSGSGNVGIVDKHHLRSITFYRYSFSDTYYFKSEKADSNFQNTKANYAYIGQIISYGLLKRLTLEAELGYFMEKVKVESFFGKNRTYGFSNAILSAKYVVLKTRTDWELTLAAGAKLPFNRRQFSNEFGPLPPDLQPSSGAYGFIGQVFIAKTLASAGMKFIFLNRFEVNGRNQQEYQFGNTVFSSLFISKRFKKHWIGMLQFRNERRDRDNEMGINIENTGGHLLFASPQLSYTFPPNWSISLLADFPLYRKYNDMQLGPRYAFGISLTKELNLRKDNY